MQDLINAHRRAYAAFIMIINEQNRLGGEEEVSRECEVDILLARIPSGRDLIIPDCASPASVYGTDKEDLLQQVETIYKDHASRLFWLERHSKDLYDTATNLLDDLHIKNLSFVAPAFEAWQKNRNAIAKKKTDLEKKWKEANVVETTAFVALLRHHGADNKEETQRAAYICETNIINNFTDYADALLRSFIAEPPTYIVNQVYWSYVLNQ